MIVTPLVQTTAFRMLRPEWAFLQRVVANFSRGYGPEWDPVWQGLHCNWRRLWFNEGIEPPSWLLDDYTLTENVKGIIFASAVVPGGINLVIYNDRLGPDDVLEPYDPESLLPRDQSSWQRS